jgi:penicillin-binding protein 1A
MGYDQPRSLGGYAQGGRLAAPIFKQFVQETRERWGDVPFRAPEGVRMVRVDRVSGKKVFAGTPGTDPKAAIIWEAFKPDTEPRRTINQGEADIKARVLAALEQARAARLAKGAAAQRGPAATEDFVEEQGGIY